MRRSVIAVVAVVVLAVPLSTLAAETTPDPSDPMQGWKPPKVRNEQKDRAEIQKLFKAMEAAGKKGDVDAAASLIDFPVLMLTDDSKGEAHGAAWSREQWVETMEPFYKPMPDMKVKEKPNVFLISDSLATVTNVATITMGKGKPITTRNSMLLARVGGEWKVKAMVEGGWGDTMPAGAEGASATGQTSPSSPDQTAPSAAPGSSGATNPDQTSPATRGENTPTAPGETSPTAPGETSPTAPGQTSPTAPGQSSPTAPGEMTPPSSGQTTPPAGSEPPPSTTR